MASAASSAELVRSLEASSEHEKPGLAHAWASRLAALETGTSSSSTHWASGHEFEVVDRVLLRHAPDLLPALPEDEIDVCKFTSFHLGRGSADHVAAASDWFARFSPSGKDLNATVRTIFGANLTSLDSKQADLVTVPCASSYGDACMAAVLAAHVLRPGNGSLVLVGPPSKDGEESVWSELVAVCSHLFNRVIQYREALVCIGLNAKKDAAVLKAFRAAAEQVAGRRRPQLLQEVGRGAASGARRKSCGSLVLASDDSEVIAEPGLKRRRIEAVVKHRKICEERVVLPPERTGVSASFRLALPPPHVVLHAQTNGDAKDPQGVMLHLRFCGEDVGGDRDPGARGGGSAIERWFEIDRYAVEYGSLLVAVGAGNVVTFGESKPDGVTKWVKSQAALPSARAGETTGSVSSSTGFPSRYSSFVPSERMQEVASWLGDAAESGVLEGAGEREVHWLRNAVYRAQAPWREVLPRLQLGLEDDQTEVRTNLPFLRRMFPHQPSGEAEERSEPRVVAMVDATPDCGQERSAEAPGMAALSSAEFSCAAPLQVNVLRSKSTDATATSIEQFAASIAEGLRLVSDDGAAPRQEKPGSRHLVVRIRSALFTRTEAALVLLLASCFRRLGIYTSGCAPALCFGGGDRFLVAMHADVERVKKLAQIFEKNPVAVRDPRGPCVHPVYVSTASSFRKFLRDRNTEFFEREIAQLELLRTPATTTTAEAHASKTEHTASSAPPPHQAETRTQPLALPADFLASAPAISDLRYFLSWKDDAIAPQREHDNIPLPRAAVVSHAPSRWYLYFGTFNPFHENHVAMVRYVLETGAGVLLFPNDDANPLKRASSVPLADRIAMVRLRAALLDADYPGRVRVVAVDNGGSSGGRSADTTDLQLIGTNWPGRLRIRTLLERKLSLESGVAATVGFMLGEDSWRSSLLRADQHKQSGVFALLKDRGVEHAVSGTAVGGSSPLRGRSGIESSDPEPKKLVVVFPRSLESAQVAEKAAARDAVDRFWVGTNFAHLVEFACDYEDPVADLSSTALRTQLAKAEADGGAIAASHLHPRLAEYARKGQLYRTGPLGLEIEAARDAHVTEAVREHYDARAAVAPKDTNVRAASSSVASRNTHNLLKSCVILRYAEHVRKLLPSTASRGGSGTPRLLALLDIGCGKGGDLAKYRNAGVGQLLGIDVSRKSLEEALRRARAEAEKEQRARHGELKKLLGTKLELLLVGGNAFGPPSNRAQDSQVRGRDAVPDFDRYRFGTARSGATQHQTWFHAVSSMFACHYAFEKEESARALMRVASARLCEGGVFFGVIPNMEAIVGNCSAVSTMQSDTQKPRVPAWRTACFSVEFRQEAHWRRAVALNDGRAQSDGGAGGKEVAGDPYGVEYTFSFTDGVEECAEPLVHWPSFVRLAAEFGLELVQTMRLSELVPLRNSGENGGVSGSCSSTSTGGDVERLTRQYHYKGGLNSVVGDLYRCFAFKKTARTPVSLAQLCDAIGDMAHSHKIHDQIQEL
eukprot:g2469.t1